MRIVRYADDFKIFCRSYNTAVRTFHAVKGWLKDRLKLDISPEKSKIVNLRKRYSDFLGFKSKVHLKKKKYTVVSNKSNKAANKLIEQIKCIQKPESGKDQYRMRQNYNSKVMGIHNYYKIATRICIDCRKNAYQVTAVFKNRMRKNFKSMKFYKKRKKKVPNISKAVKMNYGKSDQIRFISNYAVAPIGYIQNKIPKCKKKSVNKYTRRAAKKSIIILELIFLFCCNRCETRSVIEAYSSLTTEFRFMRGNIENAQLLG